MVNVRKSLLEGATEDTKYRCIGAVEIRFRMHELGYSEDDTPNLSTIKRIIKRNCLIVQKRKRYIRCKSKKRYTLLNPTKVTALGLALMHPMRSHLASNPTIRKGVVTPGMLRNGLTVIAIKILCPLPHPNP